MDEAELVVIIMDLGRSLLLYKVWCNNKPGQKCRYCTDGYPAHYGLHFVSVEASPAAGKVVTSKMEKPPRGQVVAAYAIPVEGQHRGYQQMHQFLSRIEGVGYNTRGRVLNWIPWAWRIVGRGVFSRPADCDALPTQPYQGPELCLSILMACNTRFREDASVLPGHCSHAQLSVELQRLAVEPGGRILDVGADWTRWPRFADPPIARDFC